MATCTVIKVEGTKVPSDKLGEVSRVVSEGGVIGYPTDTFYALGTHPGNVEGVERIYRIKGRERRKPILCIISELEAVMKLASEIPPEFGKIAEHFWPGPLTIVFKAAASIPRTILGAHETIGLRWPDSELPRKLAGVCGSFITATSANRSGEVPPDNGEIVLRTMGEDIDLLVDAGVIGAGKISTIIDISGERPRLVREGSITREAIEEVLGNTL